MQIKPRKDAFLLGNIIPSLLTLASIAVIGVIASMLTEYSFLVYVPVLCLLLTGIVLYREKIVYSKEDYEIREDRILVRRGGIFSDSETELQLEHVTHVKLILPWIRHKLFATGIIQVEAAGSAASQVTFRDVQNSQRVYDHIQKQLHKKGFSMSTDSLLHREGPADVGIVAELLLSGMGTILGIAFLGWPLLLGAITFSRYHIPASASHRPGDSCPCPALPGFEAQNLQHLQRAYRVPRGISDQKGRHHPSAKHQ